MTPIYGDLLPPSRRREGSQPLVRTIARLIVLAMLLVIAIPIVIMLSVVLLLRISSHGLWGWFSLASVIVLAVVVLRPRRTNASRR